MANKKPSERIVKTLYAEQGGKPLRLEFTDSIVKRLRELQGIAQKLPLKKGEHALIEYGMRKGNIMIRKKSIDIGREGYEGWDSYLYEKDLKSIDDLPEVYFSSMFLYYLQGGFEGTKDKGRKEFKRLILSKHKEMLVWKKIEGDL